MKKNKYCIVLVTIVLCMSFTLFSTAGAEPIKLKAVGFLPKTHPVAAMTVEWVKRVNETFKGKIEIKYLGGPEITAAKEQLPALKNGLFDINFNVTSYYSPYAPELNAFQLSKFKPWEERKPGGFYDYMAERHRKIGVNYLGRWIYGSFYIWTKKEISRPADLANLKIRVGPMYIYFMKELGVSSVSIKPADIYTALQRGTVDGFAWPLLGARNQGFTENCKYLIDHPFYGMDATILFNMSTWNKLPKNLQQGLMDLTIAFEKDMVAYFEGKYRKERELLKKAKVKFVKFSEADARSYLKKADDAYWGFLEKKVPKLIPDLRRVTGN